MNQTVEGRVPAARGGHNRDVWQERILAQIGFARTWPNPR